MSFRIGTIGVAIAAALVGAASANAQVVNISATADGEQTGGADCNTACEGALINPVQVTFAPGTYTIGDAYSPATGLAPSAQYDAWNFEAGNGDAWVWHWKALSDDGSQGSTINPSNYASHLLLDIDPLNPQEAFPTEAAAAAFGAATSVPNLTFATTTTVDFVVNDYYLPDNAGGVSLAISRVGGGGPEPATWSMMMIGIGMVGFALRRRAEQTARLACA